MKNQFKGFVMGALTMLLIIGFAFPAYAAYQKQATLNYNNIKLMVNGAEYLPQDAAGNKVEPFIIDGTTYLPVRAVADAIGYEVNWNQNSKTVELWDISYHPPYCYEPFSIPDFSNVVGESAYMESEWLGPEGLNVSYDVSNFTESELRTAVGYYDQSLVNDYGFYKVKTEEGRDCFYNPVTRVILMQMRSGGVYGILLIAMPESNLAFYDNQI
jgi:hypothetical protein